MRPFRFGRLDYCTPMELDRMGEIIAANFSFSDTECNLLVLNFASNLIHHLSNHEMMVDVALETMADFSGADRTALFSYDDGAGMLSLEGVYLDGRVVRKPALPYATQAFQDRPKVCWRRRTFVFTRPKNRVKTGSSGKTDFVHA